MSEDRERFRREMDEDRAVLEHADEVLRDIDRILERHRRVMREVMPRLRRLGLVR